jgi:hypothetical protein
MIEGMATDESRWVENWSVTGPLLEEQRRRELRSLSAQRALFCAEALFSMPWPAEVLASRRRQSGLLQQQDLFRRLHSL